MTAPTVYYVDNGGRGWATVELLARLTAQLLDGPLVLLDGTRGYRATLVARGLLPRRSRASSGPGLVIAPHPGHLNAVLTAVPLRAGHAHLSGWVIDSFWTERIPRLARRGRYDTLFVTDAELVDNWHRATGTPVQWLPFGTDALERGSAAADRPVDVQRVGRQPEPWDDDAVVADLAAAGGLSYRGRVPFTGDALGDQGALQAAMAAAKFTVSFSNGAAPAAYTHPQREYLTGRWTDALGAGATVAGIAPRCEATRRLLWPEATLELGGTDPAAGLVRLREAVAQWTPRQALLNRVRALERLDWRWRVAELATTIGLSSGPLTVAIEQLRAAIDEGRRRLRDLGVD